VTLYPVDGTKVFQSMAVDQREMGSGGYLLHHVTAVVIAAWTLKCRAFCQDRRYGSMGTIVREDW
jgi:hypothetical protein